MLQIKFYSKYFLAKIVSWSYCPFFLKMNRHTNTEKRLEIVLWNLQTDKLFFETTVLEVPRAIQTTKKIYNSFFLISRKSKNYIPFI